MSLIKHQLQMKWYLFALSSIILFYTNCNQSGFKIKGSNVSGQSTSNGNNNLGGNNFPPPTAATSPLMKYAWHLQNNGQIVFAKTAGIAGNDLKLQGTWSSGIQGNGIRIQVSDDGIEDTHEDLNVNFLYDNTSKDYTVGAPYTRVNSPPHSAKDNHGTNVAGLIAAVGGNNLGANGISPKAKITSANFLSDSVTQDQARYLDQATGNFDISNMSWGATQNSVYEPDAAYEAILKNQVLTKRNGKGSIYVKAAGNDFVVACNADEAAACIGNSNFDPDNATPYMIVTGALNALGNSASYSSVGSNLWISGFGGEFGNDSPAMLTTDRTGCSAGYAAANSTSTVAFEKGGAENATCNYTATFNGTSSAAPTIAGTAALLLEANPNLSWRDLKYILAKTAIPVKYNTATTIPHPLGTAVPAGYAWELPWVQNSAGFKFHNWYGFGVVNIDAAVQLAKAYNVSLGSYIESNWVHTSGALNLAIPDNLASGVSNLLSVAQNIRIEAVQIKVWATHADISELAIELTSPTGTRSILVNMRNSLTGIPNYEGELFLSNAFFQESSLGNWTIKIVDGAAGNAGALTKWQINFAGANQ